MCLLGTGEAGKLRATISTFFCSQVAYVAQVLYILEIWKKKVSDMGTMVEAFSYSEAALMKNLGREVDCGRTEVFPGMFSQWVGYLSCLQLLLAM